MRFARSWLLVSGLALVLGNGGDAADAARPNLLIILADDLGWGDVSCNNPDRGRLKTPHLDRLAAEGLRFTDAHSSSGVCSPSRYTLLTGRYHWRSRLQQGIVNYLDGPLIAPQRLTLAALAKQHGYHTACIGKWHLGWEWNIPAEQRPLFHPGRGNVPDVTDAHRAAWETVYSRPIAGGPLTRGFDVYFGADVPNWPPYCFIDQDRTAGIPTEFLPPHLLTNHLASLPGPALAGWKLEGVLPALTERACRYITERSQSNQPFLLYLPLTTPHTPLAVNEPWRGQSGLGEPVADLILETDAAVGRVLQTLDDCGVSHNTLVLFTSDNGFAPYVGVESLERQGHYPSGPFRGYKGDAWEGGHRVPFLVRWPAVVAPGGICNQLVHQADVMATVADLLGAELPPDAGEDSFSLLPLLRGSPQPVREHAVSCASNGLTSLRRGSWKILFGRGGGGPWQGGRTEEVGAPLVQLYDLADDPGETTNHAASRPDLVAELTALMEQLVTRGRSTPGPDQSNDVPVRWRRHLQQAASAQ